MLEAPSACMVYDSMNNPCRHNQNVNKVTSVVLHIALVARQLSGVTLSVYRCT